MAFDSLIMTAVTGELRAQAIGARIQRIYQPDRNDLLFYMHRHGEPLVLLLSCHPQWARIHLTGEEYRHPEQPAPFCMLLRKYLIGAAIAAFRQHPPERVLEIEFKAPEALPTVKLIAEIMGRRSNIVLVDERGIILGAVRTAGLEQNAARPVMPGEVYRAVPAQNKLNPLALECEELGSVLLPLVQSGVDPAQALVKAVAGVSPLAAAEIVHRCGWDEGSPETSVQRFCRTLQELYSRVLRGESEPTIAGRHYAAFALAHLAAEKPISFSGVNEMLDYYYSTMLREERSEQLRRTLRHAVDKQLVRLRRKLAEQQTEYQSAEEAPRYRVYGELLLAYGHQVPRGANEVELPDLYQPGQTVTVPLDPALPAAANAQRYFARYRKAQKGLTEIEKQLARTRADIDYHESLLYSIERSDAASLAEIQQELVDSGLLRPDKKARRRKETLPEPLAFKASSGRLILVGRNNHQNDYLTFKLASRRDCWLHAKDLPGSHVVIKDAPYPPPEEDLIEAALLAAYFSRGKDSSATAVDYTQVRHVRRSPGGRPGFVLYDNFHTITVNPQSEQLQQLLAQLLEV